MHMKHAAYYLEPLISVLVVVRRFTLPPTVANLLGYVMVPTMLSLNSSVIFTGKVLM